MTGIFETFPYHSFTLISSSPEGRLTICELTELAAHPWVEGTWHRGTLGAAGGHRARLKQLTDAKIFIIIFTVRSDLGGRVE